MKIQLDKQAHAWACLAIMLGVSLFANPLFGFGAALLAGALKEVWDGRGHGTKDFWDFVATAAGAGVGLVLYSLHSLVA